MPAPCKECGIRPKLAGRHRCIVCQTRLEPIGEQIIERDRRLAMVPEELRRSRVPERLWPKGQRWCAGCQSFVELRDIPKGAHRCRACQSGASHGASILKTYGLTADDYETLLELQGGKCAICRAKPKSKRLAVDHDHKSGRVRGLLCSRCNHDLLGSAWDSMAMALALWHYMNTPPATGEWIAPELGLEAPGAVSPSKPSEPVDDGFATVGEKAPGRAISQGSGPILSSSSMTEADFTLAGGSRDEKGTYKIYHRRGDPPPF